MCHWYMVGDAVQDAWAADDVVGHRAVGAEAKALAVGADVVLAGTAVWAGATDP